VIISVEGWRRRSRQGPQVLSLPQKSKGCVCEPTREVRLDRYPQLPCPQPRYGTVWHRAASQEAFRKAYGSCDAPHVGATEPLQQRCHKRVPQPRIRDLHEQCQDVAGLAA